MSRGTAHNALNRARQLSREEAAFEEHDPELQRARRAIEASATARRRVELDRRRGRLDLCSVCREFFRSNSQEVGVCVRPSCQSKTKQP